MATDDRDLSRRQVLGAGAALGLAATAPAAPEIQAAIPAVRRKSAGQRVDFICSVCAGNGVARDAWAEWDAAMQEWVLGAAFDDAFCHDCEMETKLVRIGLATREPTGG